MDRLYPQEVDTRSLSPLTLAFVGDGVYGLMVRELLACQANRPNGTLHRLSVSMVRAVTTTGRPGWRRCSATSTFPAVSTAAGNCSPPSIRRFPLKRKGKRTERRKATETYSGLRKTLCPSLRQSVFPSYGENRVPRKPRSAPVFPEKWERLFDREALRGFVCPERQEFL